MPKNRMLAARFSHAGLVTSKMGGTFNIVIAVALAALTFVHRSAFAQIATEVISIGTIGGNYSKLLAISPNGQWACGEASTASGEVHAIRYNIATGLLEDLGGFGGQNTVGVSVNDDGVVAANVVLNGKSRAAKYSAGFQMLPVTEASFSGESAAIAINREGDVIGQWTENTIVGPCKNASMWYSGASNCVTLIRGYFGDAASVAISNRAPGNGALSDWKPWCVYVRDYAGQVTRISKPGEQSQQLTFPGSFYPQASDVNIAGDVLGYNSNLQLPNTYPIWYRYAGGSNKQIGFGSVRRMAENGDVLIATRYGGIGALTEYQIIREDGYSSPTVFSSSCTYAGSTSGCLAGYYRFDLRDISESDLLAGSARLMQPGTPERGIVVRLSTRCRPPTYAFIESTPQAVIPGANAILRCVTNVQGTVQFAWKRYDIVVDPIDNPSASTATLLLNAVDAYNSGLYTCEVRNECGSITTASPAEIKIASRETVRVEPRGTYLRTDPNIDRNVLWPTTIELSRFGIAAGDHVRLTRLGFYEPDGHLGTNWDALIGVFTPNADILSIFYRNRVPGALDIGLEFVTASTSPNNLPTDIPHDFYVGGQTITIPNQATHLFVGPHDRYFSDNTDYNGDYAIEVVNFDPNVQPCTALTLSATSPTVSTVMFGESISLSTLPSGSGPYNYRWTVRDPSYPTGWRPLEDGQYVVNGVPQFTVTGATGLTMTLTPLQPNLAPTEFMGSVGNPCALAVSPPFAVYTCAPLSVSLTSPSYMRVPIGQPVVLGASGTSANPIQYSWARYNPVTKGWLWLEDGYTFAPSSGGGPSSPGEKPIYYVEGSATSSITVTMLDPVYAEAGFVNFQCIARTDCAVVASQVVSLQACLAAPTFSLNTHGEPKSVAVNEAFTLFGTPPTSSSYSYRWEVLDTFADPTYPTGTHDYKWRALNDGQFIRNSVVQFEVAGAQSAHVTIVPRVAPANWRIRLAATLRNAPADCSTAFSEEATIVPCASVPLFASQPAATTSCAGGEATFSVSVAGDPLFAAGTRFDWQLFTQAGGWKSLSTVPVAFPCVGGGGGAASISAANAPSVQLRVRNCGASSQYLVRCVLSSACGTMSSAFVKLSTCPADLNCDGYVDDADFAVFVAAYNLLVCDEGGMPENCPADLTGDDNVDDSDFVMFLAMYNELLCP